MLGLPEGIQACLFDLDGVLTKTAAVHAAAWTQMFDEFLRDRARNRGPAAGAGSAAPGQPGGEDLRPFDTRDDYDEYVDGKPRADGVRDFLASRGITLPEGRPGDPPGATTVRGLGNRKNALVLERIERDGVAVYDGSVRYLRAAAQAGVRRAVVSSSANTAQVLRVTGLEHYFEVRVDGVTIAQRRLHGKPAPDTYLDAARQLGVAPGRAAVFEDALSGVAAGRAGHFGYVVGVDRVGQADALTGHGASRVVKDLADLLGSRDPA